MTTTHDTNPTEAASTYYDADPTESVRADNEPQTTASAWSSSPLGQLDHEVRFGFAQTGPTETIADDEPRPDRKKAILAAALAAGVIAGSGIGVMLFDYGDSGQPTVVVPRSEERLPSPSVAPPIPARPADRHRACSESRGASATIGSGARGASCKRAKTGRCRHATGNH